MLVSCEFEIQGKQYKIERGRKPAVIKFYVDGQEEKDDEAQGDSREKQKDITESCYEEKLYSFVLVTDT